MIPLPNNMRHDLRVMLTELITLWRAQAYQLDMQTAPLTGAGDVIRGWIVKARKILHLLALRS